MNIILLKNQKGTIMDMTLTDENDIKRLVKQAINPTDLANAIIAGDRKIVALTNREIDEWSPSDNAYGQLQIVGATFAAWTILMGWDPKMYLEKAKEMWKAYMFEIEEFHKIHLPESKTDPDIVVAESEYSIYQMNPDYRPFMSSY